MTLDDAIVVVMEKTTTVDEYFAFPESNRPRELVYGYVREPAMPTFGHEAILLRLAELLRGHVREHKLGEVCRADVVLDQEAGLIVQPDLFFIATERMGIVSDRVWGAPDLVIEILSPGTEHRDRTLKLAWYRRYGVKECWLVVPRDRRIEIVDGTTETTQSFGGEEIIRSSVLPDLALTVKACFE
jgi:Uma2 family endonuclease